MIYEESTIEKTLSARTFERNPELKRVALKQKVLPVADLGAQ